MDAAGALRFAESWKGKGSELKHKDVFWFEFAQQVLGIQNPHEFIEFEHDSLVPGYLNGRRIRNRVHPGQSQLDIPGMPSRREATRKRIDAYIPTAKVIIEQKSSGSDLDEAYEQSDGEWLTPLEQALRYNAGLAADEKANYVITCNFEEFRIYDIGNRSELFPEPSVSMSLDDLPANLSAFSFMEQAHQDRIAEKKRLSVDAALLMARLRDELAKEYELYDLDRSDLAVLMSRILFCLYAEDSTLFRPNQFRDLIKDKVPDQQGAEFRETLEKLFDALSTPAQDRERFLPGSIKEFPYVNGGLFSGRIAMPYFTEESKRILLEECCSFQWSQISPALFGSLFESVLSPEQRHDGGMHYTSVENIDKVTHPLFLDDLGEKLIRAGNSRSDLIALHDEIAGIRLLDPACGSGNFLTQSYIELRRLENRILDRLQGDGRPLSSKVRIDHFCGIEINGFAVRVAETAMQIAKHQMDVETGAIIGQDVETLPLTKDTSIVEGNALTMDWNDILPSEECSYIVGNPPFLGAKKQSKEQKDEIKSVFHGSRGCGSLDYVAGWLMKAAEYARGTQARCAFVATNSICQGAQAAPAWKPIFDLGMSIDFAHDTFRWSSEAADQAHVFVVVVGFSRGEGEKVLYHHETPDAEASPKSAGNINPYLRDAADTFLWDEKAPICDAPAMRIGNKPIDGGRYLFTTEEMVAFIESEPEAESLFRPWMGSSEFIRGESRYVLWLGDLAPNELRNLPKCMERVRAVRDYRLASKSAPTRKIADMPTRFHVETMPKGRSVLVPKVSSEGRRYIPLGFVEPDVFCSDLVFLIPDAGLYHFGVLHSQVHNAWMRTVCGRLESRYRYSRGVVYNNFPWPGAAPESAGIPVENLVSKKARQRIEACAQAVLDARKSHPGCTIADLYDPNAMPSDLRSAHRALDAAVERAYGAGFDGDEDKIADHLFALHATITGGAR